MKKLAKSAAMMAFAFAALVVSCQKEIQAPADVSEEALEAKDCFVASFDQSTKTTIDGNRQVKWAEDDSIAVNGVIYKISAILNADSTKAEFKKCDSKPTPAAPFTAVFPAEWCTADGKDIVVPTRITRKDDKDFSMPMKAQTTNRTMVFSNTFGVLAVKVEKDILTENKVDSITVLKNENDTVRVLVCSSAQSIDEDGNIFYVPMAEGNYDSLIVYANKHEMFSRNNKDIEIKAGSLYAFNYQVSLKGINIDEQITDTVLIILGKDTTFNVVFTPADATNKKVTWSSSDTTIAKVSASQINIGAGYIDTYSNAGEATLVVTSEEGGYTDTVRVIVKVPVDSVLFGQNAYSVELDSTMTVSATVYPSNASYPDITWTSLNTEKLEVDSTGIITAKDTGAVKLVATADGKSDTCDVNIICKVTSVKIDTTAAMVTLTKYDSLSLTVTVKPDKATNAKVNWNSLTTSNVSVDATGKIKALEKTTDSVAVIVSSAENSSIADTIYVKVFVPIYTEGGYSGEGIKVAGIWWAPVNCGYDAINAPTGLFYQWGRKYGHLNGVSTTGTPANNMQEGNGDSFKDYFFKGNICWYSNPSTNDTWSSAYDPCPEGWRVPTKTEFTNLENITSSKVSNKDITGENSGLYSGWLFSESGANQIFLPASGLLGATTGIPMQEDKCYYWSSTPAESFSPGAYSFEDQDSSVTTSVSARAGGESVRCVKK